MEWPGANGQPEPERSVVRTKPSILIVDDEKTQREGLRAALDEDFDVYLADSADAAMELLERETFQVLLTDFRMPKDDGMKLVARAKSLPKPPVSTTSTKARGRRSCWCTATRPGRSSGAT